MNIENMTDEQLADALAEVFGWTKVGTKWRGRDETVTWNVHPFEVGDLSEVASGLPQGWFWMVVEHDPKARSWNAAACRFFADRAEIKAQCDVATEWRARAAAVLLAHRAERERAGGGA